MKKVKLFLILAVCSALSFTFTGCGSDEEVGPSNEIVDATGITISLEWTTGGTTDKSKDDIDLDMYLLKGTDIVEESAYFGYESIDFKNIYQDGEYEIRVIYYEVKKAGTYTIYATSKTNPDKVVKNTGSIVTTQQDSEAKDLILRITKKGSSYTIVQVL